MEYSQIQEVRLSKTLGLATQSPPSAAPTPEQIPSAKSPSSTAQVGDAAVVQFGARFGNSGFVSRLEKHIDDYYKGRGNVSRNVSFEISGRARYAAETLDPINSKSFGSYLTLLPYGQRSRFINGVSSSARQLSALLKA